MRTGKLAAQTGILSLGSEFDQYNKIKSRKVVEISLLKIYNGRQKHEGKIHKLKADLK